MDDLPLIFDVDYSRRVHRFYYKIGADKYACKRCGAAIVDLQQHYRWHQNLDSIATMEEEK